MTAVALLLTAFLMNRAPIATYFEAKAALAAEQQQVAQVQSRLEELQEQAGKLSEPAYLELEARKDLSYARPGEEMFVVEGLGDATTNDTASSAEDGTADGRTESPGLLERIVSAICNAF